MSRGCRLAIVFFIGIFMVLAAIEILSGPDLNAYRDIYSRYSDDWYEGDKCYLPRDSYEILNCTGSYVTGDAYNLTKTHKLEYYEILLDSGDLILVSVRDKFADRFAAGKSLHVYGSLEPVPEVMDVPPDPSIAWCLNCDGTPDFDNIYKPVWLASFLVILLACGTVNKILDE